MKNVVNHIVSKTLPFHYGLIGRTLVLILPALLLLVLQTPAMQAAPAPSPGKGAPSSRPAAKAPAQAPQARGTAVQSQGAAAQPQGTASQSQGTAIQEMVSQGDSYVTIDFNDVDINLHQVSAPLRDTGGNREAARFTGIPLARNETAVYVIAQPQRRRSPSASAAQPSAASVTTRTSVVPQADQPLHHVVDERPIQHRPERRWGIGPNEGLTITWPEGEKNGLHVLRLRQR